MATVTRCDLAIVGGGLAGSLIALALRRRRPDCDVRLIDGGATFGGNHLWSFFASDIAATDRWIVAPLVVHSWPAYDVCFPRHERTLKTPYYSITSERLDQVVRAQLPPDAIMTGRKVLGVSPCAVTLLGGDRIEAGGVIDARGAGDLSWLELGWQKFLGRELALAAPHRRERPVVMDATVAQIGGYRFAYVLPFGPDRMFIEDTYYSDGPEIDRAMLSDRIDRYAAAWGWKVSGTLHEEAGALPVALGGDFEAYWATGGNNTAKAGVRAGLFHPTTGYSLPDAVRTAALIAATSDLSGPALHDLLHAFAAKSWRQRRFYRALDRMLFRAAEPEERWRVLARFYTLDAGLIGRFYAGRSTMTDQARILSGKPPVPIGRAIRALRA
jgi:lycopene beta-cyclase